MHSLKCTKSCECKVIISRSHAVVTYHSCTYMILHAPCNQKTLTYLRLQLSTKYRLRFISNPISLIYMLYPYIYSYYKYMDIVHLFTSLIKKTNSLLCFRAITTSLFKTSLHRLYLTYCTQITQLYIYMAVFPQKIIRVGKCMKIYSLEHVNTHNFSCR
jgi:hypothetical protein